MSCWPRDVAFAFGLLHGFGFAGVLPGLGRPQATFRWRFWPVPFVGLIFFSAQP